MRHPAASIRARRQAGRVTQWAGTTLAYYAAWAGEADQRASRILATRLVCPGLAVRWRSGAHLIRPRSPYQAIATGAPQAIHTGPLASGAAGSSRSTPAPATPCRAEFLGGF